MTAISQERASTPQRANTWRCDRCGRPIADGHGYISFTNPFTGAYPDWTDADERRFAAEYRAADEALTARQGKAVSLAELAKLPQHPGRCRMQAYHRKCDPLPDHECYWIKVEECRGLEVLDWIAHLLTKVWFGATETKQFIRKYREGISAADAASPVQVVRADAATP